MIDGFVYTGSCNCNGTFNKKYKYNDFVLYVTKSKFKLKHGGTTIKGYSPIELMETYIRQAIPQLFTGSEVQNNTGV